MDLERNLRVKVQECEDLKEQLGAAEEANFIGDGMIEDLRAEVQGLRKHRDHLLKEFNENVRN